MSILHLIPEFISVVMIIANILHINLTELNIFKRLKTEFVMENALFIKEGNSNGLPIIERSGYETSLYRGRYLYVVA